MYCQLCISVDSRDSGLTLILDVQAYLAKLEEVRSALDSIGGHTHDFHQPTRGKFTTHQSASFTYFEDMLHHH